MKDNGISQLPVLDNGRLVGIVTEHDLLGRLVEGCATLSSAVAEVMFRSVNTVHRDQDAGCLLSIFARNEIGLVVDDSGTLIGLITKMDLVDTLAAKHA
jgi:cystathionine beta-synthase